MTSCTKKPGKLLDKREHGLMKGRKKRRKGLEPLL